MEKLIGVKHVIKSYKKWKQMVQPEQKDVKELSEALDSSSLFAALCLQRGLHTEEQVQSFLQPNENWFHDPFLLYDMEKAVNRIKKAISNEEKITVYADYDADGVTSASILVETLETIGAHVDYYIPNRFVEGYGPNTEAFEKIIASGTSLIVTCDNGVSGHEAIKKANELGIDVVVTDHHEIPETLPEAFAIVHPRHPEGEYPFGDLSGAGVSFKVAAALLEEIPWELLDLAAIGTVADLVSLVDENRAIVKLGLMALRTTQRIGLLEMYKKSGLKPSELDETSIGFVIGPRLNALGRMGDASPAVKLLLSLDPDEASQLADLLNEKNEERKKLVSHISNEAFEEISKMPEDTFVYVIAKKGWHEGVLGIVASRVVNKTGKPTIILTIDEEKGIAKGSGRSVDAFHLYEAVNQSRQLTLSFGGHHMAAGLSLPIENIPQLRKEVNEYAIEIGDGEPFREEICVNVTCDIEDISIHSLEELTQLAPFGTGNPVPNFLLRDIQTTQARKIGADKNHLKCTFQKGKNLLDGIGFGFGEVVDQFGVNPTLSVVGTLEINEWNGNRKPQMKIVDLKSDEPQFIDKRGKRIPNDIWSLSDALFVFFTQQAHKHFAEKISQDSVSVWIDTLDTAYACYTEKSAIVFVDCPDEMDMVKAVLSGNHQVNVYACFNSMEGVYVKDIPNRQTFANVYKYIMQHQEIDVRNKGDLLAKHLKIDRATLEFMILVFFEAGFVTIEDGVLNRVDNPEKSDLTQTNTYRQRLKRMQTEETLTYSSFVELADMLNQWMMAAV